MRWFLPLAAILIVLAGALTACGAEQVRDAAVAQCLREAERIQDPRARTAAEEGCRAGSDGELSTEDAKASARRRCLDQAERIADAAARREAEQGCEDIR